MIREGKIPDLPKPYTPHLGQVVKAMLKQNVGNSPSTSSPLGTDQFTFPTFSLGSAQILRRSRRSTT